MATTRKPSIPKTSADIKNEIVKAQQRLAALEKQLYAEDLHSLLKETNIVSDFEQIRGRLNARVPTFEILSTIAAAVGIKGITITMTSPVKRKPGKARAKKPA